MLSKLRQKEERKRVLDTAQFIKKSFESIHILWKGLFAIVIAALFIAFILYQASTSNMQTKIEKIFQIGFNKAGTTSLFHFFDANNISSVHWTHQNHKLCELMHDNYNANKLLLDSVEHISFYSDFGVFLQRDLNLDVKYAYKSSGIELYKLLVKEYPIVNSLFILNIRNVYHWLHSRFTHYYKSDAIWNLKKIRAATNIGSNLELLVQWKALWYQHICGVIRYFENNQINHHLLIFDVEIDDIQKLIDFGHRHAIELDAGSWAWKHQISKSELEQSGTEALWQNITYGHPELNGNDDNRQECERIDQICTNFY